MFVVFEGIDGSGKTTISNRVAERLVNAGLSVKHLRAGGEFASLVTQAIRELGRDARNFELEPTAEFLLYLARDVQLLNQILRPALASHDVVIADRSYFTAQVLGQFGRHLSAEWIEPMLQLTTSEFKPDLVVLVDVDPKLARARRKTSKLISADRRPPSRKGLAGVGLQYRLQSGYLQLAQAQAERWAVLPNQGTLDHSIDLTTRLIVSARSEGVTAALRAFRSSTAVPQAEALQAEAMAITTPGDALDALLQWVDAHSPHEPHVAAYMLGGLWGEGIDARREQLTTRAPQAVLAATAGLDDTFSWQLRERLAAEYPRFVAQTLNAFEFSHPRAQVLRESLLEAAPEEVLRSLSGSNDEAVWTLRERLFQSYPNAVVVSLMRLANERAWTLRNEWLQRVVKLDKDYETAKIGLKTITWLDGDQAWSWREKAQEIAPIAALGSLNGVVDAKSWEWRGRFLRHAPKVVMATLRRMTQPLAWEMRRAVAADCKEAIDSISALGDEEAWQLRDAYCDHWPSTVVKSLGPQADEARGQALLLRQLRRYPGNLSLLQHAAAIAIGAHRQTLVDDDS